MDTWHIDGDITICTLLNYFQEETGAKGCIEWRYNNRDPVHMQKSMHSCGAYSITEAPFCRYRTGADGIAEISTRSLCRA